jgi:hypothetical protein
MVCPLDAPSTATPLEQTAAGPTMQNDSVTKTTPRKVGKLLSGGQLPRSDWRPRWWDRRTGPGRDPLSGNSTSSSICLP